MKRKEIVVIVVLGLAQAASAAQSLTVNGDARDAIIMKTGQTCTVEVVSDNSNPYSAYIGFDDRVVLGNFDQPLAMPEAGDLASITEYDVPAFYGYYVSAAGTLPPPSPGVHFVVVYRPKQVGETELILYDAFRMTVFAKVHITVVSDQMGTVFTYQGGLLEAGSPADGQYDFEFKLYNAPSYGSQLAGTIETGNLDVIDGYFTTELDFGSDVFNGDACWLEISVRPGDSNDPNAFINLSPRQYVTPTPYALQTRGIFVDNSGNVGIGTKFPDKKLTVSYGDFAVYPGQSEPSIITDGYNVKLGDPDGMRNQVFLEIDDLTEKFVFNNGNVGIRTTSPQALLDIANPADGPAVTVGRRAGNPSIAASEGASGGWIIMDSNGAGNVGLNYYHDGDIILGNGGGNVGIGTTNPSVKLDVVGTDETVISATNNYLGGSGVYGHSDSGIGVYGFGNSGVGVYGYSDSGEGVIGHSVTSTGVIGKSSQGKGVYGYSGQGNGVYGESDYGYAGYFAGDVFVLENCSALSFTDRTPYPKDLETAYEAVMSMKRLTDGQYDENSKEAQLDHAVLSDFVLSKDGNRDLSATVSCHNEVLKDLIRKQQELSKAHIYIEQLQKQNRILEARLGKLEAIIAQPVIRPNQRH